MQLSEDVRQQILKFQQTEITEHHIYKRLSRRINSPENAKILEQIAEDELRLEKIYQPGSGTALVFRLVLLSH
jgi:hypothetical protein